MPSRILISCVLLAGCAAQGFSAPAQRPGPAGLVSSVILIGDAGSPVPDDPILAALSAEIARAPDGTTVVFLGDNVYPNGMPDSASPGRADAERRLDALSRASAAAAAVFFVPGNHDWGRGNDRGWVRIQRQADHLARTGEARLLPAACPGPEVVDVSADFRLLLLDTQWWFEDEPGLGNDAACARASLDEVARALDSALVSAGERAVIVAAHHPLLSSGPHGGQFTVLDHIFPLRHAAGWAWLPLPVIGSAYPIARRAGISRQDESSSTYRRLTGALTDVFNEHPPLIYAGGHEHSLEVHEGPGARYTLVSGGGPSDYHSSRLRPPEGTLFASNRSGFVRVDAFQDGRLWLSVIEVDGDGVARQAWGAWLQR